MNVLPNMNNYYLFRTANGVSPGDSNTTTTTQRHITQSNTPLTTTNQLSKPHKQTRTLQSVITV
jgi:hypothetical protein